MDKRRPRAALEAKQLPPQFWENLKLYTQKQPKVVHLEQRLLERTSSVKSDKHTQSPLLKIFKDIMQREKTEREQEKEMSFRRELDTRRLVKERPTFVISGKPPKCVEMPKSFQAKPSVPDLSREKEVRQSKQTNHNLESQEEHRSVQKLAHDKRSSHTTDRHRTPEYNKSYVTSAEKTSGSRSGSVWKAGCQPMQDERRPSQVKTDPVSVVPMSLKKKMFWKKKDKNEVETKYASQYTDVANIAYADRADEFRRRSHHSKLKVKSNTNYKHGKKPKRSDNDMGAMEDDCCEIICETDDIQGEEGYFVRPEPSETKENITLWQDPPHCWTYVVTEIKKYKALERAGVTLSLILLTVLIVGGVMYYYKTSCKPKSQMFAHQHYDFDALDEQQRVKKSYDYGVDNFNKKNWDDDNIKSVDGIAGLSDYLGIRDLRELQLMALNNEPNSLKLKEFIKRLIETDNQIKEIRKNIMGDKLPRRDPYFKSDRYKRSIPWRHGPRLFYKKNLKDHKPEGLKERTESMIEQEAREVQEKADETQKLATKVAQQATTDVGMSVVEAVSRKSSHAVNTIKKSSSKKHHYIPTIYKDHRNNKKSYNDKERPHRNMGKIKRDVNKNEQTTEVQSITAVGILIPKNKFYALYNYPIPKITKCTHVSKEHKSHEERLKHPYYKNTEHIDRFLDMILESNNNASRVYDTQINEMFKHKKTKCKHPSIEVGPVKFIQEKTKTDSTMEYLRGEMAKLKKILSTTQLISKNTHKMNKDPDASMAVPKTTPSYSSLSKITSPKYNIFMSILTINPDQRTTVTDDLRNLGMDRKLHSRRLMQIEEDEDIGLSYENLKEVLSDDDIHHENTDRRVNKRKKRKTQINGLTKEELIELHVVKPTKGVRAKLYNPNWKGPIPLFPDELNLLIKRPLKHINKVKIPIRNNDVLEENDEDESVFSDVDYVEDYSINGGIAAKRAQAYSDYGVLDKVGGVILSSKRPSEQDEPTTKITDKLKFGINSNPSIRVKKSKSSINEPPDFKENKNSGRIGRTLKSIKKLESDFTNGTNNNIMNLKRIVHSSSIKIKSLNKHRHDKINNKHTKNDLYTVTEIKKTKLPTKSVTRPIDGDDLDFNEDLNLRHNKMKETTNIMDITIYTTEITDYSNFNISVLDDIFQEFKLPKASYDNLNDKVSSLLNVTDLYPKSAATTASVKNKKTTRSSHKSDATTKLIFSGLFDVTDSSLESDISNVQFYKTAQPITEKYSFLNDTSYDEDITKVYTSSPDISEATTEMTTSGTFDVTDLSYKSVRRAAQVYKTTKPSTEKYSFFDDTSYDEDITKVYTGSLDISESTAEMTTLGSFDVTDSSYESERRAAQFYRTTKPLTKKIHFSDDTSYDEETTKANTISYNTTDYIEGDEVYLTNSSQRTKKEKDLFSYLANWLCAIVGVASNESTTTMESIFEEKNVDSIERKYRTRSLKSVDNKLENNTSENATDTPVSIATSKVLNVTTTLIENNVTSKEKDIKDGNQHQKEAIANKTLVKRNADAESGFVYFSDIYDEDYGVDLNPYEKASEKRRNKMFMKKQKEWIQKKVKKLGDSLHPHKKMLMAREQSKLEKDAETAMKFNDTRFRRNSARPARTYYNSMGGPIIDFNILNSKMQEICSQAVNEVQQMRKIQAREEQTSNPTSSLMQQLAQLMSDLVDLQVKQKTCRKLPPDLQEFLLWLTSPETSQPPSSTGSSTDAEFAGSESFVGSNDYGIAGFHDLEATMEYQASTGLNENMKPKCVHAMQSVENLLYEYDDLNPESKKHISGVKDYLNNQLHFLRNQIDLNDLSSVYDSVRYRRETNEHQIPQTNIGGRDKRKFVRNFSRKHTKTTANSIDDSLSATEQLSRVAGQSKIAPVTIDDRQKVKGKKYAAASNARDRRNLRDVYFRAVAESNKFSTSSTTEKHS